MEGKGGTRLFMTYKNLVAKYPNRWVLTMPNKRDDETKRVTDWKVINTTRVFNEAERLCDFYRSEGMKGICIIDTGEAVEDARFEQSAGASARFIRVWLNLEKPAVFLEGDMYGITRA